MYIIYIIYVYIYREKINKFSLCYKDFSISKATTSRKISSLVLVLVSH